MEDFIDKTTFIAGFGLEVWQSLDRFVSCNKKQDLKKA